MAHCFSVVDNFDGKFVKAVIELPFTGEFVTDGWLPNILVNLHGSHEQLKKWLKFPLRIERSDNTCHQFSLFSSNAWLLSHIRNRMSERTYKFSDLNGFNWKSAGEKFKDVFVPFLYLLEGLKCVFESYSYCKLNH